MIVKIKTSSTETLSSVPNLMKIKGVLLKHGLITTLIKH